MQKILIVEDDTNINNLLQEALSKEPGRTMALQCTRRKSGSDTSKIWYLRHPG